MTYKTPEPGSRMAMEYLLNPSSAPRNLLFESDVVQKLASALLRVAQMDPETILAHVTAGDEVLPRFSAENLDAKIKLRSWDEIDRAKPGRLSPAEYQQFLVGEAPSRRIDSETLAKFYDYLARYRAWHLRDLRVRVGALLLGMTFAAGLGFLPFIFTTLLWPKVFAGAIWGIVLGACVARQQKLVHEQFLNIRALEKEFLMAEREMLETAKGLTPELPSLPSGEIPHARAGVHRKG